MPTFSLNLTHARASDYKGKESDSPRLVLQKAASLLNGVAGGVYGATSLEISQDAASATVTLSGVDGVAATGSYNLSGVGGAVAFNSVTFSGSNGAWTVTIRGVVFSGNSAGVDADEAADLAAQVAASIDPLILGVITATDEGGGLVNLETVARGAAGNAYTLAVTGTGVTRATATFTGGLDGAVTVAINGTTVGPVTVTNLDDTPAAAAVASAIEANGTLGPLLAASSALGVVNLTWGTKGVVGNAVTLAVGVSTTGTATRSGATLTGGADNDVTVTIGGAAVVADTTTMSNADAASAVAAAITADAPASEFVTASASSNVVTLTARAAGDEGNGISLLAATTGGTATASGATLSGGTSFTYSL